MNILHLSPYVPDLRASHAGGVLMGKTVETLKKNHRVTVLTFCNDEYERKLLADHPDYQYVNTSPKEYARKVLTYPQMPNMFALRRDRLYWKKLCEAVEKEQIEAIHAEYTAMGQYIRIKEQYPHIRFTLTEHDVTLQSYERKSEDSTGAKRRYYRTEARKVARYEGKYIREADLVFALNGKDRDLLREKYGAEHVRVIHPYYGIDFDAAPMERTGEKNFCFIGHMGRSENHEAAMRLIRIFREMNPEGWKLTIIGAHPRPELTAEESDRVHVTGFVEDINAEITKAQFAVFPLIHGAGIKLKVLLAFGLGLPVITTHVGAEGIDPEGTVIRLAETDEEFRREIETMMGDPALREQLSRESRAYAGEHFHWSATEQIFREVYG